MSKLPKIKSTFAILDVMGGRNGLVKLVEAGGKVNVTITGTIERIYGNDDGESREFEVRVSDVSVSDGDVP